VVKTSTSDSILNYLSRHNSGSAEEISRVLNTSTQNIRYHLNKLSKAGIIQVALDSGAPFRATGRKRYLYSLSARAYQNNYSTAASAFFKIIKKFPCTEPLDVLLRSISQEMFPIKSDVSSSIERLNRAIQLLNEQSYHARWEAHFNGPNFFFHNCPYAALLPQHSEFCRLDCLILEHLTGIPYQVQSRIFDHKIPSACLLSPTRTSVK